MENLSCAFFGHSDFDYSAYENDIRNVIVDLINRGVTEFYNGFRGLFDVTCARIVYELKTQYPQIKSIQVLSYIPDGEFTKSEWFDETVYLLEKKVPFRFAISHTNRKLVEKVDYVVSGVKRNYGGAKKACDYAKRLYRTVLNVVDGTSYCDYDENISELEEKRQNEQFVNAHKEELDRLYEKISPQVKAIIEKQKK